jgi:tripartite-type tricarboxylate transporter receptor subunit TctC
MDLSRFLRTGLCALALALFGIAFISGARAQNYPTKPIRLIVPYPPGGMSDSLARVVMPRLGEVLGQQIVVESKPGAGGNLGTEVVVRAAPDGYTLLLNDVGTMAINAALNPSLRYDPLKDLAPVTMLAYSPFVLAGSPQLAAKSLAELIAYARANPGKLNFAFGGQGSSPHLTGVALAAELGIEWTYIAMKGGGDAIIAVAGNHADFLFAGVSSTLPHIKSGRLKALAVAGETRISALPDVPTVAEAAKLPGFVGATWQGILAPPGTPRAIIDTLNGAIRKVVAMPQVTEQLNTLGAIVAVGTPEQLTAWMQTEKVRWEKLGKAKGITLE